MKYEVMNIVTVTALYRATPISSRMISRYACVGDPYIASRSPRPSSPLPRLSLGLASAPSSSSDRRDRRVARRRRQQSRHGGVRESLERLRGVQPRRLVPRHSAPRHRPQRQPGAVSAKPGVFRGSYVSACISLYMCVWVWVVVEPSVWLD